MLESTIKKYSIKTDKIFKEEIKTNPETNYSKAIDKAVKGWIIPILTKLIAALVFATTGFFIQNSILLIIGLALSTSVVVIAMCLLYIEKKLRQIHETEKSWEE